MKIKKITAIILSLCLFFSFVLAPKHAAFASEQIIQKSTGSEVVIIQKSTSSEDAGSTDYLLYTQETNDFLLQNKEVDLGNGLIYSVETELVNEPNTRMQAQTIKQIHNLKDADTLEKIFTSEQKTTFVYDKELKHVHFSSGSFNVTYTKNGFTYTGEPETGENVTDQTAKHGKWYTLYYPNSSKRTNFEFYATCNYEGSINTGLTQ